MLTHSLNNQYIPLPLNFSMRLTIQSPVCNFQKIPFSYSIDFSLPLNRITSAIFGHPERVAKFRASNDQKYPGYEVRFDGAIFMRGTLHVSVSGNSLSCTLVDLVGELNESEQERTLLEIPKFSEPVAWENKYNYQPDVDKYCCFPVINGSFFRGKGQLVERTSGGEKYSTEILTYCFDRSSIFRVNQILSPLLQYIKLETSTIEITGKLYEAGRLTVVSPFFFLKNIIREALKANGMHITSSVLDDDDIFKNFCIYNNYDITQTDLYQSGEVIWEVHYNEPNYNNEPLIADNINSGGFDIYSYGRSYGTEVIPKNHLPKMKVGEMLVSTQNLINVCFDFLPNRTVKIYSREDLLKAEPKNLQKYMVGEWLPGEKKQVALKFMREHDTSDQVFAERFKDISDRREDIKDPVATWYDLDVLTSAEGDIRYIIASGVFAEYKWLNKSENEEQTGALITTDRLGWEEISIGLQNGWYAYGRSEVEEFKTAWSTCYGTAENTLVNQPGKMANWRNTSEEIKPRLLINKEYNSGGNQTAGFTFEYEGDNGLIKNCWQRTAKWWANRLPIVGKMNLPANALRSIIWNKCLPYRTDDTTFMIDKIEVDIYIDRIGTAEITAYKRD